MASATRRDDWRETFVSQVQEGATTASAAREAGVARSTPYRERAGNADFAAAWATAATAGTAKPQGGGPRGRSGTVNTAGYISDSDTETNYRLMWPYGLRVWEEMRRTEPSARWMLALVKVPLLAGDWTVEPASQDPEDLEIAAALEHNLYEELDGGWAGFMAQALTFFDFGHSVFERVAELREIEFSYEVEEIVTDEPPAPGPGPDPTALVADHAQGLHDQTPAADCPDCAPAAMAAATPPPAVPRQVLDPTDGKVKPPPGLTPPQLAPHAANPPAPPAPKPKRKLTQKTVKREAFVVSRLAPRLQRTIQQWFPDPRDSSRLDRVKQFLSDGLQPSNPEIEGDRLLVFTHEKEGDDWRGTSLLRSAYKAYRYKKGLENAEAIGFERSIGLPVVYPPQSPDDGDLQAMEDAVAAMRQGENLYIIMPGPKAENGVEGWSIEDLSIQGEGGKGPDINQAISRYDAEMARSVLAEFMRLGHEVTGARATAEVQQNPYWQALEAAAGYIESIVNVGIARPFVDWNYETDRYPRIRCSKLQAHSLAVIADALSKLITAGGVTADPELENFLRSLADAPPRSVELSDEMAAPKAPDPAGASETQPGEGPSPGEADDGEDPQAQAKRPGRIRRAVDRLRRRGRSERFAAFMPRRPLLPGEDSIAFDQVIGALDNAAEDLPALCDRILRGQVDAAQEMADRAVELNRPELLDSIEIDPAPLEQALNDRLGQVFGEGRSQVRAELRAQGGDPSAEAAALRNALSPSKALETIRVAARAAAEEAAAQAKRAAKLGGIRRLAARRDPPEPGPGAAPLAAARQAITEAAKGLVNRAFGLGREQELRELQGSFDHFVYTAILDENCCGPCEDADGSQAATPEDMDPPTPNPECQGGDRCRCLWYGYLSEGGGTGGGVGFG